MTLRTSEPSQTAIAASMDVDVVVVGAGIAGLSAARAVLEAGRSVVVLEATERVGGRTRTVKVDGLPIDVGGQWVGPTQEKILALIREQGVEIFPTPMFGDSLRELAGVTHQLGRTDHPWTSEELSEIGRSCEALAVLVAGVDTESPWLSDRAEELDTQTFDAWIDSNVSAAGARTFWYGVTQALWTVEPPNVSLLHVLFLLRAGGGLDFMISPQGGQASRMVGGAQQISEGLAKQLGDRVVLNSAVVAIAQNAHGATVVTADGREATAQRVIVAVPPTMAGRIRYAPALPAGRDMLTQRMALGSAIKCQAVYSRPFWRDRGLSGHARTDQGLISFVYDNSPHDSRRGVLLGFVAGDAAIAFADLTDQERRAAALESFTRLFGAEAAEPLEYVDLVWAEQEWARGSYASFFGPGGWTALGKYLREPIGRIHWAGTETATVWYGYMDGAASSGQRAAREALDALAAEQPQ